MTTSAGTGTLKGMDAEVLAGIYTTAVKIKLYDEKYRATMRAGKIGGMYYSPRGQEIIPSAISAALAPEDYVLTIYRGVHDQIAKGVPLPTLTAEFFGRASGSCKGKGGPMHITDVASGLIVTTGVVGSGLPIGTGVALSAKLRNSGQVTIVNFGDGASNIGAFHEALNLASVWNLPVVFVCQNNRYAEYTTLADGTSVDRISDRGAAYGMRSIHVDGNDPEAMYGAARTAIDEARAGNGPTLVEAMTYRFFGHVMGDGMEYMPEAELQAAVEADPVARLRENLLAAGHRSEAELTRVEDELQAEIDDAFEYAISQPMAKPEEVMTDVYAEGATR